MNYTCYNILCQDSQSVCCRSAPAKSRVAPARWVKQPASSPTMVYRTAQRALLRAGPARPAKRARWGDRTVDRRTACWHAPRVHERYLLACPPRRARGIPRSRCPPNMLTQWLRTAESKANLPKLWQGLWHPYRRKWTSERMQQPLKAVADAGGWKDVSTLLTCYQHADDEALLAVMSEPRSGASRGGAAYRTMRLTARGTAPPIGPGERVPETAPQTAPRARKRRSPGPPKWSPGFQLPLLGSNQDSPDPESGVLPVTPRGSKSADWLTTRGTLIKYPW